MRRNHLRWKVVTDSLVVLWSMTVPQSLVSREAEFGQKHCQLVMFGQVCGMWKVVTDIVWLCFEWA